MSYDIKTEKSKQSKIKDLDFNNIPLGKTFTDHMFICDYEDGEWRNPRIKPLQYIPTHPAAMALHYGQAIFEGMKATKSKDGAPMLFRPELNAKRLNHSASRMGMPILDAKLFLAGLKKLVALESAWIPSKPGSALYLRPFMYADEPFIGMRAATHYKFVIIASPSGPFFTKRIKLYAEKKYIRAMQGGTGEAKAAGNYAAAIKPTEKAKALGYDQVLWLDGIQHKYIQEVGTMNIFFKIKGEFITPQLDGAILNGITRRSVIDLLKAEGYQVKERPISIDEIVLADKEGTLEEAFGTGTAVGIAMILEIGYDKKTIRVSETNEVGEKLFRKLEALRTGRIEDTNHWMVRIEDDTDKKSSASHEVSLN